MKKLFTLSLIFLYSAAAEKPWEPVEFDEDKMLYTFVPHPGMVFHPDDLLNKEESLGDWDPSKMNSPYQDNDNSSEF